MKLYLRRSNCSKSDEIRGLMHDGLWRLVTVEHITSTEPFLHITDDNIIHDPIAIVEYLQIQTEEMPPVMNQLQTAKKAATKALKHALKTGQLAAPPELTTARREICDVCPFNKKGFFGDRCQKCGCGIKAKTATATEFCPIHKW